MPKEHISDKFQATQCEYTIPFVDDFAVQMCFLNMSAMLYFRSRGIKNADWTGSCFPQGNISTIRDIFTLIWHRKFKYCFMLH